MTNQPRDRESSAPAWRRYLRLRGADGRADVADELEFHIDMIAARHVANGVSPDEARARARTEFGDMERARRLCEDIGAEQERRHEWSELLDSVRKDVRFAVRSLRFMSSSIRLGRVADCQRQPFRLYRASRSWKSGARPG